MALTFSYEILALRPVRREDGDMLLVWRNHPSVRQSMYTGYTITYDEHQKWLDKVLSDDSFAIFIFEIANEPIGVVGFSDLNSRQDRTRWTFYLRPDVALPGAGTAMGFLALEHVFDAIGVRKLEGEVLANNEKSLRFHQRLGFREEGLRRAHVFNNGDWCDVHEFSLLRDEWPTIRSYLYEKLFTQKAAPGGFAIKPRLLFTGGGGSASQSLQAQWGERYELFFADANPNAFPPSIPEARRLVIPFANDPTFCDAILALCKERKIDLIVPCVDEELLALAEKKGARDWPRILTTDADFVALMLDKLTCARALEKAGLDAPRTLPLERGVEIGFPLIAKPRSGRGSRGVMRLERENQISAYLALHGGETEDYVAQQLIGGDEYTVFVAADGHESAHAIIPVLAQEKRGITLRAVTDPAPQVLDYVRAFQAHFRASGCYNIQCMLTPEGRVFPFEVNPRISTTFVLAIATGYDPIPMALGLPDAETDFKLESNWVLQRSWLTEITQKA